MIINDAWYNEELKIKVTELIPSAIFEEGGEWITFYVDSAKLENHLHINFAQQQDLNLIIYFVSLVWIGKRISPWCII